MRRAGIVLLAFATILAGCPSDAGTDRTVTPAEVPELPTGEPTVGSQPGVSANCDVARPPPAPDRPPEPVSGPASIPVENGSVNATTLIDAHEATLSNYRYRLSAPQTSIVATENQSAFLATVGTTAPSVSHYAIDGTLYTHYFEDGGRQRFGVSPYQPNGSTTVFGGFLSLTGGATIERALRFSPHRVAAVRLDNWTVLRASVDEPTVRGSVEILSLNSTILLDRRGIVRSVETRMRYESLDTSGDDPRTNNVSLRITDVGTATFERPDWVCEIFERKSETDEGRR